MMNHRSAPIAARAAGALWLVTIVAGLFAEVFVRGGLIVPDDPGATASNIMRAETFFRLGLTADLIGALAMAGATLLLYDIFRPAGRRLAVGQLCFGFAGCIILAASLSSLSSPLILLGRLAPLGGMNAASLNLLALGALKSYSISYNVSLAFFAVQVALIGLIILRSDLFPKLFGILFLAESVCNASFVLAVLLAPAVAGRLGSYILLPGLPAELGFAIWLLAMGVKRDDTRVR
jgi:hypothetical protein